MKKVTVLHLLQKNHTERLNSAYLEIAMYGDAMLAKKVLNAKENGKDGVHYEIAATFDGSHMPSEHQLDYAFQNTNSINRHWSSNDGIECTKASMRSTMVGDVILNEDGAYFVNTVGFIKLA
jgi:hypothetical protein